MVSSSCSLRGIEAGDEQRSRKQKVCSPTSSCMMLYRCIESLFSVTMFFIAEVSLDIPTWLQQKIFFSDPKFGSTQCPFWPPQSRAYACIAIAVALRSRGV